MVDFEGSKHGGFDVENGGEKEFDMNSNSLQDTPASASPGTRILAADANGIVVLPAGVSPEDISAQGRDIVITLADGSTIIIPDGAIIVPQMVIDGVAIPPQTVAALLNGTDDINPEAEPGQLPSSGGEFDDGTSSLQDAFDLGDLLPYTELSREVVVEEEIIPFENEEPDVVIITPDNPVGVENAIATVDEDGLPVRGEEPEGTRDETDSEITSGTIVFEAPDGLSAIILNGEEITSVGQTFTTIYGTLEITSIDLDAGTIGFIYTLEDNLLGETVDGNFTVTVIDRDGDSATANLSIIVIDDNPIAVLDTNTVPGGTFGPITGNVLDNDESGADDYPEGEEGEVEAVISFTNGTDTAGPGETLTGQWGELTLNADGSYTYTRFYNTPGDQTDTFNYTITDQDGSTASADLVITIGDAPNEITFVPEIGEGTEVYEGGLPPRGDEPVGSGEGADDNPDNNSDPSEETGATVTFNSPDGVASVTINGTPIDPDNLPQTIVSDATGTLVITGYTYDPVTGDGTITYEYTLGDNTSGDDTSVSFIIEVTDLDGDEASDTLTIDIIDDEPTAVADTDEVTEDGPLTAEGNVITDAEANGDNGEDTVGADDASVSGVAFGAAAGDVAGNVGANVNGAYGTLVLNADGSYTYTLDNTNPLVQGLDSEESLTETFTYTLKDGDGDTSTTTLTITVNGADDPVVIHGLDGEGAEEVVDEDDLADGTSPDAAALTQDGTFTITSVDGLASLTVGGTPVFGGGVVYPVTISGAYGDVKITGVATTLDGNGDVVSATVSYEYILSDNTLDHPDAGEDSLFDHFEVIATDTDGSNDVASLDVRVIDDVPETDENAAITLDDDDLSDGNVGGDGDVASSVSTSGTLAHEFGADGGSIDFAVMNGETVDVGGVTVTYTWDADNSTLTANDGTNDVFEVVLNTATGEFTVNQLNPLDHHLVGDDYEGTPEFDLTYTVTDGDDDTATGTLTVRVNDDTPEFGEVEDQGEGEGGLPQLYTDDTNVDPDTDTTDSDSAFFSGLFNPLFGADGQAATDPIVYSFAIDGDNGLDSGLNDSITDENILLRVSDSDPNVIEGYLETSGDLAFTLTLDPETSEITQEQFRAIEHDDPLDPDEVGDAAESMAAGLIKLTATITDGDGDQAENTVDIGDAFNFEDDGVDFSAVTVGLNKDEDNISGGNNDSAAGDNNNSNSANYLYLIDYGSDGPGIDEITVSLLSVTTFDPSVGPITLTSGGLDVVFDWNSDTNTMTGYTTDINDPVLQLVFDVDAGTFTVDFLKPLDHPSTDADGLNNGPEIGYEDNITITFNIVNTDGDGDTFTSQLNLYIDDDMAVAGADAITIGEGESDGGTVLGNDSAGADGYAADGPVVDANFVSGEQGITVVPNGKTVAPDGTITIVTTAGTLVLHTDGTYTFDADANKVNADADIVFSYTIEDGDGDQTTANLTITIENVAGRVEDDDAYVDEGGLPGVGTGELNAPADDVDFDGEVDQDPESDQSEVDANGSIRALDNLGDPLVGDFTYSLDDVNATPGPGANEVTLIGNYGTLVLNTETGAYTYTLTTRYDHEDGLGENDSSTPPPADSFDYTVTDEFGNEIGKGSIDVTIKDDIPVIEAELDSGSTVSVDETDMVQGNATIDLDGNTQGNDTDVSGSPTIVSGTTAAGGNGVFNITTLLYGADGEAVGGGLDYDLVVNSSVSGLSTTEGLAINLVEHEGNSNIVLGMVEGTDIVAFAIEIDDATGELTVEQYLSLHHTQPTDDLSLQLAEGSLQAVVSATDGDADEVSIEAIDITSLITFLDDTPTGGSNATIQLDDDNWAGSDGNVGVAGNATDGAGTDDVQSVSTSGTLTHDFGNDGGSIAFATTGAPAGFRYQASGSDILIQQEQGTDNWVTVVTVTLNPATGAYTVTQNNNVLHDNADAENNVEFTLSYTVTDGDEDTAPGTLVINVDDDTPVSTAGNITVTVDEDGLQGGIPNNGTNDADGDSTGILTNFSGFFSAGADAPLTYAFDPSAAGTLPVLYSGGVLVTYVVTATSITATADGSPVFTFTILDPSTGAAQFSLQGPLDHPDTDDSENLVDITVDFGPLITATDADGDTVTKAGSYNVVIDDDSPSFGANNATAPVLVTDDDDIIDTDTADFSTLFTPLYGADGPAAGTSITYALSITGGNSTASGLVDSVTGKSIYLYLESGEIVGRVGDSNNDPDAGGAIAFTLTLNANGTIEQEQSRAIYHDDPTDPDEEYNADPLLDASETMAADLIKLTATITDYDGDSVTSDPISIGDSFHFEDDGPSVLLTDPLEINNDDTPFGSGSFALIVGADANSDNDDISVSGFTVSVNGSPVSATLTPGTEDAVSANYTFSFDYNTGTGGTTTATGTLVFYKSGPKIGTYEVELTSGPIEGFTINSTSDPSTAIVEVNPNVSVAGFDTDFFAQFTGVAEPNSGTGTNNLRTIDYDPDLVNAPNPSPETAPGAWEEGELFNQAASTVQVSSTAAGVGGNTIQGGEVLDFNLYSSDPGATTGGLPTASATSMYLKFDTIGSSEDMIVVLKLWNDTNGNGIIESTDEFTTRALMIENSDILKSGPLPAPYNLITLDNNDGIIFIESNDYNGAGETYQIVGAQIVGSDEGVTGTAINFNNNTGIGGASNVDDTGTYQALSTDTDDGPFKITSIGFVRPSTSDQTATLEFDVTVTDADGDSVTQTDVTVTFGDFPATPIVLDLDGGGNEFVSSSSNLAAYDYDGDGVKTKTAWIAAGSAILFHDTNGDGVVTDASEFVFGHDGMTDMEAVLKLYDSNNNGQLDQGDAEYGKFGVWMDDGDAQAENGEFASLESMHITSIDLVSDGIQTVDGDGDVTIYGTSTFSIDGVVAGEASDAAFALGSDVDGAMMEALLAMSTQEGSDGSDPRTTDEVDVIVKDVLAEDVVDAMLNEITGDDGVQLADAGTLDAATLTHVIDGGAFVYVSSHTAILDDQSAAELTVVHA